MTVTEDIELYKRRLQREVSARKQAEALIEEKSLELYRAAQSQAEAERALRESEERYRTLVELSPDAIIVESGGSVVYTNDAAVKLLGAESPKEMRGRPLLSLIVPDQRDDLAVAMGSLVPGGRHYATEGQMQPLQGAAIEVALTVVALSYQGRAACQLIARDITERKRLERELHYQATHDGLTGLPERTLFMDRLNRAIAFAQRNQSRLLVAFLDLDRFKAINDSLGHDAGDQLLKITAARIQGCIRKSDTVARMGGDEFVLLLQELNDADQAIETLNRVVEKMSEPVDIDGHELVVTGSVGCCAYPEDGQSAGELLKHADAAMYSAKSAGRNTLKSYKSVACQRAEQQPVKLSG